jgi:hypothetical protein
MEVAQAASVEVRMAGMFIVGAAGAVVVGVPIALIVSPTATVIGLGAAAAHTAYTDPDLFKDIVTIGGNMIAALGNAALESVRPAPKAPPAQAADPKAPAIDEDWVDCAPDPKPGRGKTERAK